MASTNYTDTLILPAEDCRARAKIPDRPGTIAALHYALITETPYGRSSDEVIGTAAAIRAGVAAEAIPGFIAGYFTQGRPCLRASPLTKTHGWAVHADARGRVALLDPEGPDCAALIADPAVRKLRAMRNARA